MSPPTTDISGPATITDGPPEYKVPSGISIEDFNLPKSIVTRLAKGVLPPNTQIQANAMLAMTKSATLFINYIASQANEHATAAERKTVNPNDVFAALEDSEFSSWRPRLEAELQKYTEIRGRRKEKIHCKDTDGEPAAKRPKPDGTNFDATEKDKNDKADSEDDAQSELGSNEEMDGDLTMEADDEEEEKEDQVEDRDEEEPLEIEEPELVEVADEALDNGDDSE